MLIELFGCSSSGKSSLARQIVRSSEGQGVQAVMSEDFLLAGGRLAWLRGRRVRTVAVDLLALAACLRVSRHDRDFLRGMLRRIARLPPAVGRSRKLNIARNVLKKTAIRASIRRQGADRLLVLMDEGTLQTAHYVFVQLCAEPDPKHLRDFMEQVPLPDVAVYVREAEAVLVERTLARGHSRIPDRSRDATALFVKRALWTLERVASDRRLERRLLIVDQPAGVVAAPSDSITPETARALELVRAGLRSAKGPA